MTDSSRRILEAKTDDEAAAIARESIAAGKADEVVTAACERCTRSNERARWLAVLPIVADEASTTALAAAAWTEIAKARRDDGRPRPGDAHDESHARSTTRIEAFDAIARAFAFEPERTESLEVVTSLAAIALPHESRHALQWLAGLVRDGVLSRSDSHRFDAAIERAAQMARNADPVAATLERVAAGNASDEDFASLASGDIDYGAVPFDRIEGFRSQLGARASHTADQAIVLSRFYRDQGESQLAWVVLANVLKRGREPRIALELMRALASSGDPDGAEYLVAFMEQTKDPNDKVRYAIHIAGSMHDHGAEEAADAWIARAAGLVGRERAKQLFDAHFALGSKRDAWLADGFVVP